MTTQRLLILGGTGFVGSHLVPRLAADGHVITLLSRNREKHRELAVLPQVRIDNADIYDRATLTRHLRGHDAALNLVGILNEIGGARFARTHVDLTATLIAACREAGVARLHQMSALNAGRGESKYLKTRGEADTLVRNSGLDWTIYRPSVIFGRGDGLVSRFAGLLRIAPLLPLARPRAKIAPAYVGDIGEAIARCVAARNSAGRIHELYGADTYNLLDIVRRIRDAAHLRRAILPLPDALGGLQARVCDFLPGKPFSLDNFRSLKLDAVGTQDGLAALGIVPRRFDALLPELLDAPARERRLDGARAGWHG